MSWDTTTPAGSEAISNGDNRIRELKTDLQTALQAQGSFPGADPSNPKYKWIPESGNTASRPSTSLVTGQLYLNTEVFALQQYNGATWDNINVVPVESITSSKIAGAVAGDGLVGAAGLAIDINYDGTTIETNVNTLRVVPGGITGTQLATSVAGDGLSGGGGSALSVNVDDSTIEIATDTLQVKDSGITLAKLATEVTDAMGQNIGLVVRTGSTITGSAPEFGVWKTLLNVTGQGRIKGIGGSYSNAGATNYSVEITIDGTLLQTITRNTSATSGADYVAHANQTTSSLFEILEGANTLDGLDIFFRLSAQIRVRANSSSNPSYNHDHRCQYEISA